MCVRVFGLAAGEVSSTNESGSQPPSHQTPTHVVVERRALHPLGRVALEPLQVPHQPPPRRRRHGAELVGVFSTVYGGFRLLLGRGRWNAAANAAAAVAYPPLLLLAAPAWRRPRWLPCAACGACVLRLVG